MLHLILELILFVSVVPVSLGLLPIPLTETCIIFVSTDSPL